VPFPSMAVAQVELLSVLGEAGVPGEGSLGGVVRDHGVEVFVDVAFEAGAVASGRGGLRLRGERGGKNRDQAEDGESHEGLSFVREVDSIRITLGDLRIRDESKSKTFIDLPAALNREDTQGLGRVVDREDDSPATYAGFPQIAFTG